MEWLILFGVGAVVFGGFGAFVGVQKRRGAVEGLMLGLLFGPLGVLVEALLPQGTATAGDRSGAPAAPRRHIDDLGVIADIAERFRTALDESEPGWERLPYHRRRALLKPIEKRVARELGMSPTRFADLAAEARRLLFEKAGLAEGGGR